MVPSSATTLFDATIPFTSLRPLSRILVALAKLGDELSFEATASQVRPQSSFLIVRLCYLQ
jgi:hypothetical protein